MPDPPNVLGSRGAGAPFTLFTSPFVVQYENWFGSWVSCAASVCHCVILRTCQHVERTDHNVRLT